MRSAAAHTVLAALVLLGCASDPPPPAQLPPVGSATTPPPPPPPAPTAVEKPGDIPTQSNIAISEEIKTACHITDSEAYFAFDSANVRPEDKAILKKLADCFTSGPLKGREMRLVGHADPRGEEEYNMVLGGRRADNVKEAIVNAGQSPSKVTTTSRGELDANGTDEASWSKDRRVDVALGK
jgi:peptidoglycan-associated lipoprotein